MENGLSGIYCAFSVCMFCMAVSLLLFIFGSLHSLETQVESSMKQQHVISCEISGEG